MAFLSSSSPHVAGRTRRAPPRVNTDSTFICLPLSLPLCVCVCNCRYQVQRSVFLHRDSCTLHPGLGACWLGGLKPTVHRPRIEGKVLQVEEGGVCRESERERSIMSGLPGFVNPFPRPRCLAAAAAPLGKAKLTHPGKAIMAGKHKFTDPPVQTPASLTRTRVVYKVLSVWVCARRCGPASYVVF